MRVYVRWWVHACVRACLFVNVRARKLAMMLREKNLQDIYKYLHVVLSVVDKNGMLVQIITFQAKVKQRYSIKWLNTTLENCIEIA